MGCPIVALAEGTPLLREDHTVPPERTYLQVAELNDACEALTLDKEQLALEKEDLQARRLPARGFPTGPVLVF